ncbi:16507_t:CDS:2, partial [Racocetra persica]
MTETSEKHHKRLNHEYQQRYHKKLQQTSGTNSTETARNIPTRKEEFRVTREAARQRNEVEVSHQQISRKGKERETPVDYDRWLLQNDDEWDCCLAEASQIRSGAQLRNLFTIFLLFCDPLHPEQLWENHRIALAVASSRIASLLLPENFAKWLIALGEDQIPTIEPEHDKIQLPEDLILPSQQLNDLIQFVYPEFSSHSDSQYLVERELPSERFMLIQGISGYLKDHRFQVSLDLMTPLSPSVDARVVTRTPGSTRLMTRYNGAEPPLIQADPKP